MNNVLELEKLNDGERLELRALHGKWLAARSAKDYTLADELRAKLIEWGCEGPDYETWHPVFESHEHRRDRAATRYLYGVYP